MSEYAERSVVSRLAAMLAFPIGGGGLGALLGSVVAPDSGVSVVVSAVMLPLALFAGIWLWVGTGLVLGVVRLVILLARQGRSGGAEASEEVVLPPGSVMFVPTAVAFTAVASVIVSALSARATLLPTMTAFVIVGLAYGLLAWRLARLGYLGPPDGS